MCFSTPVEFVLPAAPHDKRTGADCGRKCNDSQGYSDRRCIAQSDGGRRREASTCDWRQRPGHHGRCPPLRSRTKECSDDRTSGSDYGGVVRVVGIATAADRASARPDDLVAVPARQASPSLPLSGDHALVRGGHHSRADGLGILEQAIASTDRHARKRLDELDDALALPISQQPVHHTHP